MDSLYLHVVWVALDLRDLDAEVGGAGECSSEVQGGGVRRSVARVNVHCQEISLNHTTGVMVYSNVVYIIGNINLELTIKLDSSVIKTNVFWVEAKKLMEDGHTYIQSDGRLDKLAHRTASWL